MTDWLQTANIIPQSLMDSLHDDQLPHNIAHTLHQVIATRPIQVIPTGRNHPQALWYHPRPATVEQVETKAKFNVFIERELHCKSLLDIP
jgi:hypothetical protein